MRPRRPRAGALALAFLALSAVAAAGAGAAADPPRMVDARFHTSFVDVVWEPEAAPADGGDLAAPPAPGPLPEEHYDVAVFDAYFDRPLLLDGNVSLADLQQFLRTHRHHRQALYGVVRLVCSGRVVESYPAPSASRPGRAPHQLFPLPAATDSEFRWLNAVAGDYAYRLDRVGYREANRVSFAVLLRERGTDGRVIEHMADSELDSCDVVFPGQAGAAPDGGWRVVHRLEGEAGAEVRGRRRARRDRGDEAAQHFHLVERGSPAAQSDLPASFLEIPFKSLLKPAIIASTKLDDSATKLPVDYVVTATQDELFSKVSGGCAGSTAPGATKMDGPSVYGVSMLEEYEKFLNTTHDEGATVEQKYLRFLETHGALSERLEARNTPATDVVDGKLTTDLIRELNTKLTTELSVSLTASLTESMKEHVHDMLAEQLGAALERDLSVAMSHALVDGLSQTLTDSVPPALDRLLLPRLTKSLTRGTIDTVTRALTHTLGGTLTFTTKQAMMLEPFCYLCHNGEKQHCDKCKKSAREQYGAFYYLDYFSSFYSDYYSDMFTDVLGQELPGAKPPGNMEPSDPNAQPGAAPALG